MVFSRGWKGGSARILFDQCSGSAELVGWLVGFRVVFLLLFF